jgi:hypothetical protein
MAKYRVQDSHCGDNFDAADDDAALEYGKQWLRDGDWDRSETLWLDATVFRIDGDDEERVGGIWVILPPAEPKCWAAAHAWCQPYELVGGMKENPGVFGHGGGVRITEVCKHCGTRRLTDTWATNPGNGTQGHETVEYFPAGEAELEWVAAQGEVSDG